MMLWVSLRAVLGNCLKFRDSSCEVCDRLLESGDAKYRYTVSFPYQRVSLRACRECIDHRAVPGLSLVNGSQLFSRLLLNNKPGVYSGGKLNVTPLFDSSPDAVLHTAWWYGVYKSAIECIQENAGAILSSYFNTKAGLAKIGDFPERGGIQVQKVEFMTLILHFDLHTHRLVGVVRKAHPMASTNVKIKMRLEDPEVSVV